MSQHRSRPLVASAFAVLLAAISTVPAGAASTSPPRAAAAVSAHPPLQTTGAGRPHREVFGYVNAANLASTTVGMSTWDFNDLSTIALFGLHVNTDGSFAEDRGWTVWNSTDFANLVSTAHSHGAKVVPSIIFHDYSSTQGGTVNTPMCQVLSPNATSHTVSDILSEIRAKGADGFNLNYEGNNQYCPNGQSQAQMLVSFMALNRLYMPHDYISISTYNGSYYPGYYFDIPHLNPYVDSFFVMDYDSTWSNYQAEPLHCSIYCFSPNAPLIRYDYNDTNSVQGYLGLVPASKVIMGVPYYGNTACIPGSSRPGPNAVPYNDSRAHWSVPRYIDSRTTNSTTGVSYYQDSYDPFSPSDSYSTWWDADYSCWRESYWDNYYALSAKYDLVNRNNLRGVGIFTLDYGGPSPEAWSLLHDKFGGCIGASVTASPSSPEPPGAVLHLTATSTACTSPTYEFWVQYPNGSWNLKRGWGGPAFDWNTAGLPLGTYNVHAWANQSGDPLGTYESYGDMTFTLASMPNCATATLAPPSAAQLVTTTLSFSASSTGCATPQYAFWVQAPDGTWAMKRPFSFDSAFAWNTSGLRSGAYTVHVWANQYGHSTSLGEAIGEAIVTLTGCTAAAVSPAAPSQPAGSSFSFTASASTCSTPLYLFTLQKPGGTSVVTRGFSATPTWSWSTAGLAPGTYTVQAWANQQGALMTAPESVGTSTVTLTGCTSAGLSPTSATQQVGSTVSFTATSSGCPNPQYEYWVQWLNGTWHILRGFSADPTFSWNASSFYAPGTYTIHVWANQQGADTSALEAVGSSTIRLSPPCTAGAVSPSTGSSAAGTSVTFTASASGCVNPMYEFWIQDNQGYWHLMQSWSASPTWQWQNPGWGKGVYHVHVWINASGSDMATAQTMGVATYTLT